MSSISEIEAELFGKQYPKDYLIDKLRKYLKDLEGIVKGHIIFYWADINPLGGSLSDNLIINDDLEIFRDMMFKRVYKDDLYLIITSPGGRIEAAESIMRYLDAKVKNLYAIIPYMAKSAATLICLMANKIYMGYYSALGSISPLVGEKHQDAIQVIEEFNNMMNIFSQPIDTNEIIKNTINKKEETEKVEISKDSELFSTNNNHSLESQQKLDIISQSLSSIINPLIKMGYPLYEAKKAIEWVVEIANWALRRSKAKNESNQTSEINNLLGHLLIEKELKFHHRNISFNYAKQMGLPVELLETENNKKLESLVLGAQNIMRILSDRFHICKLLMASNGQVWYKEYRMKETFKSKLEEQQNISTAENESPRAACIPQYLQNSQTFHSDLGFIIEQEKKKGLEYEKIKDEAKKTGKYSKWIDYVVQNLEHYSWENRDERKKMKIEPNKRYILDTNVWLNAINEGKPHYVAILKYCIDNAFVICPINNLTEIIHNLSMMRDFDKNLRRRENAKSAIELIINLIENSKIKIVFPTETQILQAIDQYMHSLDIIQIFDYMIAYSGIANADYIISEDHHFAQIFPTSSSKPEDFPILIRPNEIEFE